ncbi:MAG: magnesium/cobalt transporter CorA [Desulfobacterales bacterium]|nr:magnesium/cobalt transporter CorA [Desulfobacterales bacterium]
MDGVHDTEVIARIGHYFKIHPLTQEDILHTAQRPKKEDFEHYLYIVLQMLRYQPEGGGVDSEQISLIVTPKTLISFEESPGDAFAPVLERMRKTPNRVRAQGCDYLAYALLDAVVDNYFVILENIGAEIDALEEEIMESPNANVHHRIHDLKRQVMSLRKMIWPLREVIAGLSKQDSPLIDTTTALFLRDVYDHTIQVIDSVEAYRDLLAGLLDLYLSNVSYRMNEVMKVLTLIATIFIPITFVVGLYGMNFKYMPELEWRWGYAFVWGVMLAMVAGLIGYFKKKHWL